MKRFLRMLGVIVLLGVFLTIGLFVFLQSTFGQDFLTRQVVSYLHTKIHSRLELRQVRFHFPDWISLEGIYLEDMQRDTLLSGGKIYVDLDMKSLLHNKVAMNQIAVENIRVKVKRTLADTTYNYDFLTKAFASDKKTKNNSSTLDISLKSLKAKQVHLTYLDALEGNDADVLLGNMETIFDKFNVSKSQYHLKTLVLDKSMVNLRTYTSLKNKPPQKVNSSKDSLDFGFDKLLVNNLQGHINLEESGINNSINIGKLFVEGDKIYLKGQKIKLKSILLENTDAFVKFLKLTPQKTKNVDSKTENNWIFLANNIKTKNLHLRLDDDREVSQKTGLDKNHLDIKQAAFELKNFIFNPENIAGELLSSSFHEKSGLILEDLHTDFSYGKKQTFLKNFYLKTPNSLLRDELQLHYNSTEQLSKDIGNVAIKAKLTNSQVAFQDVIKLAPSLVNTPIFKQDPKEVVKFGGILSGKINNLALQQVHFNALGATQFAADGTISGLPDLDKMATNLQINNFSSTKKDILSVLPISLIPTAIELPTTLKLTGKIQGKINDLNLDAKLLSDFGEASYVGNLSNWQTSKNEQTYHGKISLQNFDVGKFIKQPQNVGKVSLVANVDGVGIDPNTAQATIDGTMQQAFLKGYNYQNLALKGNIKDKVADFSARLNDENAIVEMTSKVNLMPTFPVVSSKMNIEKLDLKGLNLFDKSLSLKGNIVMDMTSTDPQNPEGKIVITNGIIIQNGEQIKVGNAIITAKNTNGMPDNDKQLSLDSPFMKGVLKGKFAYSELMDIILTEINNYFITPNLAFHKIMKPHSFDAQVVLLNSPVLQAFMPTLKRIDSTLIMVSLDNQRDTTLKLKAILPFLALDSSSVSKLNFNLFATNGKATYVASAADIWYNMHKISRTVLSGEVKNNLVSFDGIVKDSLEKNQYRLSGLVHSDKNNYQVKLRDNLLLNYQKWKTDSTGFVQFGKDGILVNNIVLQQEKQQLRIQSTLPQANSPIRIEADSLDISTFLALAQQDSLRADGKINGNILLNNYTTTPTFTGNLGIKNFTFTQIPIGDLSIKAANDNPNLIATEATLRSSENDILLTGNYDLKAKNPLDFKLLVNKLGATTIKAFSFGQLRAAKGNLTGNINIKGMPLQPLLFGDLAFNEVAFTLAKLGASYKINKEKLHFEGQQMIFSKFTVQDSLGQNLLVNGNLNFSKIPNISYDLKVQAKDFMVLNASRKDNDFFYGQGFVDANMNIRGIATKAIIEGDVKVRQPSKITVVMPNDIAQLETTDGIVQFVDKKGNALVPPTPIDSTEKALANFNTEVSLNIEADDKSDMTIVIDELNGDNIKVKGNAQLNAGITASGQPYMLGLYDLSEGTYDLTFQVLKRQFAIQKGSRLTWTGDPMKADMNIIAMYKIDAAPYDLVDNPDEECRKKIPFNVLLKMQGSLTNPEVSFDIKIANAASVSSTVAEKIKIALSRLNGNNADSTAQIRNENAEMNKQVFSLLVLNSFYSSQASDFFSNINPEAIARQSVSKVLSEQLNQLAGNLIKGVKVDLNLTSTTTDLGSSNYKQTDLNVGLSKGFLNNRLTIKVGRNFELEDKTGDRNPSEIFDNVLFNYRVTEDGRYLIGMYRKNQYQAVLDGFVVETGVNFAITMDFEKLKELIQRKK